jgi:PAS domain S-box-containing protein
VSNETRKKPVPAGEIEREDGPPSAGSGRESPPGVPLGENGDLDFEAHLRQALMQTDVTLAILDRELRYRWVANALAELSQEELIGQRADEFLEPAQARRVMALQRKVLDEDVRMETELEFRIRGVPRRLRYIATPLRDEQGAPWGVAETSTDITTRHQERKETEALQERIRQYQRLEAVSRLAAGVAHDFNNRLAVIQLVTQRLLRARAEDAELIKGLERIRVAAERSAELTRRLLGVGRGGAAEPVTLDLRAVLEELRPLLRRSLPSDVGFELEPGPEVLAVRTDPDQLEQVVVNLVANAREALAEGGQLTVSLAEEILAAGDLADQPRALPGPFVRLRVRDTGPGLDEEARRRLFEPFFTSKGDDGADEHPSGLGLATVYGTVSRAGGVLRVESAPGAGTTVDVLLPRRSKTGVSRLSGPERLATEQRLDGRGELLLVVEDDALLREVLAEKLTARGYRVLSAADATEAVQRYRDGGEPPAVLLTDVVLPGLDGPQLAQRLRQELPALRVVLQTGHPAERVGPGAVAAGGDALLRKPYASEELLAALRRALDREADGRGGGPPPDPA